MMHIRRVLTAAAALVALAATSPVLVAQNNNQNRREQERRSQQEQRDTQALVQLADAVTAGKQPAPTDVGIAWVGHHFVKGAEGMTFIPFSLTVEASKLPTPGVGLYVRAVAKNAAAPAPQESNNRDRGRNTSKPENVTYPWDDVQFLDVPADGKVSRALMLKPGEYDLVIAVKEKAPLQPQRNQPPAKTGMLRHAITVPDYNGAELTVSTPILAANVEPLQAPLSPEEQRANPYTIGGTLKIELAPDRTFKTGSELNLLFWVYGVQHNNGMPDVQIEYDFHQKTAEGEKFFNKTAPQVIDASTLPPGFNVNAGHQVLGFLGVPLKSFQPGEYRVEFVILDKLSGKKLTGNATFTVES